MATVHFYVRLQASLSNADARDVADLMARVRATVEAAGNEWQGRVVVQESEEPAPAAVAEEPPAVAAPARVRRVLRGTSE